jgi:ABC-type transport system involved in multi-copper enzyme maturation permease subunit
VSGRIYAIALNTFREAIRQRVLYGVLFVVLGVNLLAIALGRMSLHEEERVARDVGLGGVSLFGVFTAIYLGVTLLYGEIQKKTIHTIIAKPIDRWEFVVGKYAGMAATLALLVAAFAAIMALLLWARSMPMPIAVVKALALTFMEVMVVAAVAVLFSSFSTPFLSGIFTFMVFFFGRVSPEMRAAAERADLGGAIAGGALRVLPDLHLFSISGGVVDGAHVSVHGGFVGWGYVATAGAFAALYIAALLLLSVLVFSRRDFA